MLFQKRFWEPIRRGEITLTFRRWKRAQVLGGRVYRTTAGRLLVSAVDVVAPDAISDDDAHRAGHPSAEALIADLRGRPGDDVYRVAFEYLDEPDPREVLAATTDLSDEDVARITTRLSRLDVAAPREPWTRAYLEAIAADPGVRAPDLAARFGRDTQPFKTDVRKLKNLGLTISLSPGYRLSPRGEAYLARQSR